MTGSGGEPKIEKEGAGGADKPTGEGMARGVRRAAGGTKASKGPGNEKGGKKGSAGEKERGYRNV